MRKGWLSLTDRVAPIRRNTHVGVPRRRIKALRRGRRQHAHVHHQGQNVYLIQKPEKKVKSRKISPQIKKRQFRRMPVLAFLCTDFSVDDWLCMFIVKYKCRKEQFRLYYVYSSFDSFFFISSIKRRPKRIAIISGKNESA